MDTIQNKKSIELISTIIYALFGFIAFGALMGSVLQPTVIYHANKALLEADPILMQRWNFLWIGTVFSFILSALILFFTRRFQKGRESAKRVTIVLLLISIPGIIIGTINQILFSFNSIISGNYQISESDFLTIAPLMQFVLVILTSLIMCGVVIFLISQLVKKKG